MKIFRLPFDLKITMGGLIWVILPIMTITVTVIESVKNTLPVVGMAGLCVISFVLFMLSLVTLMSSKGWLFFIGTKYIPPTDVQLNRIRTYLENNINESDWMITHDGVVITKWRSDILIAKLSAP